ncbi:MAG: PaaI family thioesterase [Bacteroidales bacterium]|nr:PaaI family thioesterase [Bacteroidales bacterium]
MKKIKNPYLGLEEKGYNCFACCPENPYGLKMEFYEDGDDLVCLWNSDDHYQGWLNTLHGGIQATLMDELGGWIVNRKLQTAGMTTNLTMKYRHPVPTGKDVRIEIRGRIKEMKRNFAFIEAELIHDGQVCSMCEMTYFCFSKEKAASDFFFTGCELDD